MADETYFLEQGTDLESLRLKRLYHLYAPSSQHFMLESGLARGKTVLEIGCGTGHMSIWLARQVGTSGRVIALDCSPAQLAVAKKNAIDAKGSH